MNRKQTKELFKVDSGVHSRVVCILDHHVSGPGLTSSGPNQWRNMWGGGGRWGQGAPQRLLTGKFLLTYWEKRGKEEKGKWGKKKEN